jgi:hypothetical protein
MRTHFYPQRPMGVWLRCPSWHVCARASAASLAVPDSRDLSGRRVPSCGGLAARRFLRASSFKNYLSLISLWLVEAQSMAGLYYSLAAQYFAHPARKALLLLAHHPSLRLLPQLAAGSPNAVIRQQYVPLLAPFYLRRRGDRLMTPPLMYKTTTTSSTAARAAANPSTQVR